MITVNELFSGIGAQRAALKRAGIEHNYDEMNRVYSAEGCSPTLRTMQGGDRQPRVIDSYDNRRVRRLTPHECWRLMGFTDEAFHKAEAVCSNSQLYKQAGNSIVVDVLVGIFKNIFKED